MNKQGLTDLFKAHAEANRLFSKNDTVLLAVSGGVDSVVMTNLFKTAGLKFGIAHCNFQLRGSASDEDANFVKQLAEGLDVPFYSESFETKEYQKLHGVSLEEAARELRYKWLEEIRSAFNYQLIATAHHLNDSIETVLINLVKGTGINGMRGVPVKNGFIIRPMLFATREQIESYAQKNQLAYRVDATNAENIFIRNKIRNQVIPLLKEINPSLEETFAANMKHFADAASIYSRQVQLKLKKIIQHRGVDEYIAISALQHLPEAAGYLHAYLQPCGFNEAQVKQIMSCFGKSGKIISSKTHRVIVDRKYLILTSAEGSLAETMLIEKKDRTIICNDVRMQFDYSKYTPGMKLNSSNDIAYFDADTLEFPLLLRRWQKGDYLYPLGMKKKNSDKPGKKKVSDLLTDLKVDLLQKEKTMVLVSGEKIIWVAGVRQDHRMSVQPKTKQLLKVKLDKHQKKMLPT